MRFESQVHGKEGYYEQLEEIHAKMPDESNTQQHYDVFVHVYISTPTGERRIGYQRYSTRELMRDLEEGSGGTSPIGTSSS